MKTYLPFMYKPNLTGLTVVTDPKKQHELFFCDGHPRFLIPDFNPEPTDIWLSYQDYIEKNNGPIYDQDGGEIISNKMIGSDGLTSVDYVLYDMSLESDPDDYKEYNITIEGYVVYDNDNVYFVATKVTGDL